MRHLILLALFILPAACFAQQTDLTTFEWGAMPTTYAAVPDMACRPTFVTDGKPDTGWVCPTSFLPVWLRLEWRSASCRSRGPTVRLPRSCSGW